MKFRFNGLTYEVPPGIDIFVETYGSGGFPGVDYEFVQGNKVVSMMGPEGTTWADAGIKRVEPTERCVSCGRPIQLGEEWCPHLVSELGSACDTDLRDSNNRVPIGSQGVLLTPNEIGVLIDAVSAVTRFVDGARPLLRKLQAYKDTRG